VGSTVSVGVVAVQTGEPVETALARADDFEAYYWLVAGIAGLAAAVQMTRPGKA